MNNLEHLSYDAVKHTSAVSYAEWRKQLQPHYGIVWRDIGLGYFFLAATMAGSASISLSHLPFALLGAVAGGVLTGFVLAFLASFLHEAGHFNLHPDKKMNDRLANLVLGLLFGVSIKAYRRIHWQHHLQLGTTEDTETSYFHAPTPAFFVESFTGIHLLKVIAKKNGHQLLTPAMKKESFRLLVAGALLNFAFTALLLFLHRWVAAATWVSGMLIFFPFFATLRQLLEHRSESAEKNTDYGRTPHGKVSRLFSSGLFSRLFGSAGFNKHMIHHWDPNISYTRLGDIEQFLSECAATRQLMAGSRTTYFKTLRKLLRS